ncbi:quinoprotein relay system zinc metallohydrolase 2 [Enterovirga sp. CN4-39]|uniref:quinoprotein relay system zinc metallohydrolase 2 n=1 Tax=Enterovirga sp. CN4-39 TaxID=3400910 RepID=UPI003C01B779
MTRRALSGAWLGLALLCAGLGRISPAPAQADDPLPVQEIATGVFVFEAQIELAAPGNQGAIANLGFIVGRDAVAVIDTGGSRRVGERLLAAIRARTTLPIRYVVNTHVHPDHLLGNAAFASSGAEFIGHARLPDALAARAAQYLSANEALIGSAFAGTRIVSPTRLVSGPLLLDLGLRRIRLEAWPTGHTDSDLTVFDEATGTWFLGDLLFARHLPALDGSLRGWIANLRTLVSRQAARVVPGHGPASMPWPQAAEPLGRYLQSLEADVRAVVKGGGTIEEAARGAARGEAGRWELFEAFNARNATSAYHELEWE